MGEHEGEHVAGTGINATGRENPSNKKVNRWGSENTREKAGVKTQDPQQPQFVLVVASRLSNRDLEMARTAESSL